MEPSPATTRLAGRRVPDDFAEIELAARFDHLLAGWESWAATAPPWPPAAECAALVRRTTPRLRKLQESLDRVLVVGVVGGTGTGKSTLVNALAGERVCAAGDRRPTTTRPVVVCSSDVDASFLDLDGEPFELARVQAGRLGELVLVDCPDPDTQGPDDGDNRNLEILRRVLPRCDVILHLGTAQKYNTHAVVAELMRQAPGHEVVFVQTRAALDHDIRDDWRRLLSAEGFTAPTIYRVDSEAELAASGDSAGNHNDFGKLREYLIGELGRRCRRRIKRTNLAELHALLADQVRQRLDAAWPAVERLNDAIANARQQMAAELTGRLRQQLSGQRHLWRGRLLKQTLARWGSGPLAATLRLISAGRGLVDLVLFTRARGAVQLAVAGTWRVGQSIAAGLDERRAAALAASELGLDSATVVQQRSILDGFARDAQVDLTLVDPDGGEAGDQSLAELGARIAGRLEAAVADAATRQVERRAGPGFHALLELLFGALVVYVVGVLGRNYFYDVPWLGQPLLGLDFLVHSAIWLFVWACALRWLLLWRVQRGMRQQIEGIVGRVVEESSSVPIFTRLSAATRSLDDYRQQFGRQEQRVQELIAPRTA